MKNQIEVEVDVEDPSGHVEPIITFEEEAEEVVLLWDNRNMKRSIRELARNAEAGDKESKSILDYYR